MERTDAVNYINGQSPGFFLQVANKRGWVCPACGNGSGKDGDGIVKNPKSGRYKCFRCGLGGDIIDLVSSAFELKDFNASLAKAAEIYGVTIDKYTAKQPGIESIRAKLVLRGIPAEDHCSPAVENVSAYISKCHANVDRTDYFKKRGLSKKTIDRFGLGYDEAYDEGNVGGRPWHAVIIPTSEETYEARNTSVKPDSEENGKNKYRKHGPVRIFNLAAITEEKERPIVVCEGIFDALSIIECGGQAIALGSAVNYRLLLEELKTTLPAKPMIILFDADKTGSENAKRLKAELDRENIASVIPSGILDGYHDVNARLVNDKEGLKKSLHDAYGETDAAANEKNDERASYLAESAGASIESFVSEIRKNRAAYHIRSGISEMDNVLGGGVCTGLYVIGALSSLGKTTLALQMADGMASQGRDVLFFSLEQSKTDLMAKSVSRETFLYSIKHKSEKARSSMEILDGSSMGNPKDTAMLAAAISSYRRYADHIYIVEGSDSMTVADIRTRVKKHISLTGNLYPIVFVDYLQIIKTPGRTMSDKQMVDYSITALKQLSRDFNIPVIAISSLNRANYGEKINMAAFKESGAIEYGADVLIGLQLSGSGSKDFDIDKAKEQYPRKIDLCVLKNRNGRTDSRGVQLLFYQIYNYFGTGKPQNNA